MTSLFETLTVPSRVESIRPAAAFAVRAAQAMNPAAASHPLFETAVVEALTNAFKHGNAAREESSIVCEVELTGDCLYVRVLDQGRGFGLPAAAEPQAPYDPADAADIPEQGFGLSIIRSVFPEIRTFTRDGRFGVEMARPTASSE